MNRKRSIPWAWVYTATQSELLRDLPMFLDRHGYEVICTADYVYAPGEIPILLVAHTDTVHQRPPAKDEIRFQSGRLFAPEVGIGADDRAGVSAILELISSRGLKPYVLFCRDEEKGGLGASVAAKELESPPVMYAIELDRMQGNDAVFYDCNNPDFVKYVERFGFVKSSGTFSDISKLCPAWGIAGVNLSIGYYCAHTKNEYLNYAEWLNTVRRVANMLKQPPTNVFKYIPGGLGLGRGGNDWGLFYNGGHSIYASYGPYSAKQELGGEEDVWRRVFARRGKKIERLLQSFALEILYDAYIAEIAIMTEEQESNAVQTHLL